MDASYRDFYARNLGYVSTETQEKIYDAKLLIAGCGVGSTIAEAAVRLGFRDFILVDGDTVEQHNLNRQAFAHTDCGKPKVEALAKRIKEINPDVTVKEVKDWLTLDNVKDLLQDRSLVFDTIDFLDLQAITALHDAANAEKKPIISCISTGWGASAVYFPPSVEAACHFRRLFGLPDTGLVENESYVKHFAVFMERIGSQLDLSVVEAMAKALTIMEDGTPCPAPHVSAGAYTVASLAVTMAYRLLSDQPVTQAPYLILADLGKICTLPGIDLTP